MGVMPGRAVDQLRVQVEGHGGVGLGVWLRFSNNTE
jgi:hypothetical protein